MKSCYVSMPFGVKAGPSGVPIDFDRIYAEVIKPAVEAAGLSCWRADDLQAGAVIHKAILSAVISSEVMIVDLTTANPNVMYELGLRHAVRRGVTIFLRGEGSIIPFDLNYSKFITYRLSDDGGVDRSEAESVRSSITSAIQVGLEYVGVDSPLYDFFPDLNVTLPAALRSSEGKRHSPSKKRKKSLPSRESPISREDALEAVERAEREALSAPDVDPLEFIKILKAYREHSAWDNIISLADRLTTPVGQSPEVQQLVALALNRRTHPGDQERAISVMRNLIVRTGGDAESYGILGRIYRDRFNASGDLKDLDTAIECYKAGFEKEPSDYYSGVNAVTLLHLKGGEVSRRNLDELLPRVRKSVEDKMQGGLVGYWELATAMELSCIAREWDAAKEYARRAVKSLPSRWMLESTIRQLDLLQNGMEVRDKESLREVSELLRREVLGEEEHDA